MNRPVEFRARVKKPAEKPDTYTYDYEVVGTGEFLHWGIAYGETFEGVGNFTVALIQLPDGNVKEVEPRDLRFTDV